MPSASAPAARINEVTLELRCEWSGRAQAKFGGFKQRELLGLLMPLARILTFGAER